MALGLAWDIETRHSWAPMVGNARISLRAWPAVYATSPHRYAKRCWRVRTYGGQGFLLPTSRGLLSDRPTMGEIGQTFPTRHRESVPGMPSVLSIAASSAPVNRAG